MLKIKSFLRLDLAIECLQGTKIQSESLKMMDNQIADLVVCARFLVILFLMRFVLSSEGDIFIGKGKAENETLKK